MIAWVLANSFLRLFPLFYRIGFGKGCLLLLIECVNRQAYRRNGQHRGYGSDSGKPFLPCEQISLLEIIQAQPKQPRDNLEQGVFLPIRGYAQVGGGRFVFVVGQLSFCIDFPPSSQWNAFVVGVPVQIFDHGIAVHDKAQNPVGSAHGLEHPDFLIHPA